MLNEYPERDSCHLSPEGQGRGRRGDHVVVRGDRRRDQSLLTKLKGRTKETWLPVRREQLKATVPQRLKNDPNNPRYWLKDASRQLFITRKLIFNLLYFARIDIGSIQVFASNVLLILQIAFFLFRMSALMTVGWIKFTCRWFSVLFRVIWWIFRTVTIRSSPNLPQAYLIPRSYRVTVTEMRCVSSQRPKYNPHFDIVR